MKKLLWVAALVVGIGLIWWAMGSEKPSTTNTNTNGQNNNAMQNSDNTAQAVGDVDDGLVGTLKVSNYPARGNLMLVTDKQTIYLRTSRDFISLIGKEVNMSFEGDLNNFKLIDIQAK